MPDDLENSDIRRAPGMVSSVAAHMMIVGRAIGAGFAAPERFCACPPNRFAPASGFIRFVCELYPSRVASGLAKTDS